MAFENFWRRDRHERDRDRDREGERNRDRSYDQNTRGAERDERYGGGRDPDRGYGLGATDNAGFQRRGWREGSDYYGNNDQRYGASNFGQGSSGRDDRGSWRRSPWNPEDHRSDQWRGSQWQGDQWQSGQGAGSREGVHFDWRNEGARNQGWNDDESRGSFGSGGYGRDEDYGRRGALGYGGYGGMGGAETGSSAYGADEQFRGRGPRGYRRSDDRIREDVCEALTDDPYIDASSMDVTVKDCEVTLSGSVNSRDAKRRAESLVERLSGVKDVHNTLRVVSDQQRGEQQRGGESRVNQSSESSSGTNQTPRH